MVKDFDDLEVHKLSLDLAEWIYDSTSQFPVEEKYNVVSQLRRAVTSIGANTWPVKYSIYKDLFHWSRPVKYLLDESLFHGSRVME